jgi:hypothetical protein
VNKPNTRITKEDFLRFININRKTIMLGIFISTFPTQYFCNNGLNNGGGIAEYNRLGTSNVEFVKANQIKANTKSTSDFILLLIREFAICYRNFYIFLFLLEIYVLRLESENHLHRSYKKNSAIKDDDTNPNQ